MKFFFLRISMVFLLGVGSAAADWVEPNGLQNKSRKKFTALRDMKDSYATDPAEIQRTWDRAIVWVPLAPGRSKRTNTENLIKDFAGSSKKYPTAIYLHGCSGLWSGSSLRMKFLADNGFIVIGPASLARKYYAKSCDDATYEGGMFGDVDRYRKADAGHAIEKARSLPFVDGNNMLLIGTSEGGMTTAIFKAQNDNQKVSARVVEGWTCNSGFYQQVGINAPASEPVLALVGEKDPWFQGSTTQGDCKIYMNKENGSKSVVYRKGKLAKRHVLLEFKTARDEVLSFIKKHIDLPLTIKDAQRILKGLGYNPGPVDGAWGAKTLAALNDLRQSNNLNPVEEFDQSSQELLQSLKNNAE